MLEQVRLETVKRVGRDKDQKSNICTRDDGSMEANKGIHFIPFRMWGCPSPKRTEMIPGLLAWLTNWNF